MFSSWILWNDLEMFVNIFFEEWHLCLPLFFFFFSHLPDKKAPDLKGLTVPALPGPGLEEI